MNPLIKKAAKYKPNLIKICPFCKEVFKQYHN
jgi:hypothetical protein